MSPCLVFVRLRHSRFCSSCAYHTLSAILSHENHEARVRPPHASGMFRSRLMGPLVSLNLWAISAIGVSHDRCVEISNSTSALCHLYVHVVCSIRWGAAGVFPSPLVS
jgi:hypothetical protein